MGGFIEQPNVTQESDSNWRPVLLGVALVVVVIALLAVVFKSQPTNLAQPHPYASHLQLSDLKMSAAENFVGATVTYLDGTVTNNGDRTVTHAVVHVIFKNSMAENAQIDDLPLHVLHTSGPYPDAVDLAAAPLAPGKSDSFRLTFEHVTADWNHEIPEAQITDVVVK
jgi:hypothetical protein